MSLAVFIQEAGLELDDVYDNSQRGWSDLREQAGLSVAAAGPEEKTLRRALARLLHVDDTPRIDAFERLVSLPEPPDVDLLPEPEHRLLRMLVSGLVEQAVGRGTDLAAGSQLAWEHPQVLAELRELMGLLREGVTHAHTPLDQPGDCPLQVHARCTKREIFAGFGVGSGAKVPTWMTGVQWVEGEQADLFAFTFDKSTGGFSPTIRYRDYAISPK